MYRYLFQSGLYLVELLDELCGRIPFLIFGLFMCCALAWIYNIHNFCIFSGWLVSCRVIRRVLWQYSIPHLWIVYVLCSGLDIQHTQLLYLFQAGLFLVELLDEFCGSIPFLIFGLFMCCALAWIYNTRNFCICFRLACILSSY